MKKSDYLDNQREAAQRGDYIDPAMAERMRAEFDRRRELHEGSGSAADKAPVSRDQRKAAKKKARKFNREMNRAFRQAGRKRTRAMRQARRADRQELRQDRQERREARRG